MDKTALAIGMFDSGVGGLSVKREITALLPNEDIIYFGDTARVPYGNKSPETIIRYTLECSYFLKDKIKLLVIACNTSSSFALDHLAKEFNIPIIGVIEPAAEQAAKTTKNKRIGVLGTKATIHSQVYQHHLKKHLPDAYIISAACPLFVPFVEENFLDHPSTELIIKTYLSEIIQQEIDTLVLGCTHYPFLAEAIQKEVSDKVSLVNSGTSCALQVKKTLEKHALSNKEVKKGSVHYFVTDEPLKFRELGEKLIQKKFEHVEQVILH